MEDLDTVLLKVLVTVGFLFLIWTKFLWENLEQDSEAFYPDGLEKCPPDTYTIDDNRNRVRCTACPTCPSGMEPSPTCGSTLVRTATGDCVPCKAGTYSEEADSATCKACTDCGSKEVLSSCTTETNAKCWECPPMQYEDETTNTCKPCSFCCEENSVAQKDCFNSRTCPGNCSQSTPIKYHSSMLNKLVARKLRSPFSKRPKLTRRQRVSQDANKRLEEPTYSERPRRDIYQENYMGTTSSETKYALSDAALDKDIDGKELAGFQPLQSPTNVPEGGQEKIAIPSPRILGASGFVKTEQGGQIVSTFEARVPPPTAPDSNIETFKKYTSLKSKRRVPAILPPSVTPLTVQDSRMMPPPTSTKIAPTSSTAIQQSAVPSTTSFLNSFLGTSVALCVFGLIGLTIYLIRKGCVKQKGYRKMSEKEEPTGQKIGDDQFDEESNQDERLSLTEETTFEQADENGQIKDDLNLGEIPPDLEDNLVKRLDVPHSRSGNNEYGWVKVGNAAGISRHDLKFYKTEYQRPNGSPTKLLLEKLGSQGKTISYLIDVLQAPVVQLDSVAASIIRHRVTRV